MNIRQKMIPAIRRRNLLLYLLYAGILIGFIVLIIVPDFKRIRQTESDIENMKKKISEQRFLYEQQQIYREELKKLEMINYFNFMVKTGSEKCARYETEKRINEICTENGFVFNRKDSEMTDSGDQTVLHCSITGPFQNLRNVLIAAGKIACLHRIDGIRISHAENFGTDSDQEIILSLRLFRAGN